MAEYDPDKHCGGQRANQPAGTLCTRPKGWGTDHLGIGRCKRHGGSTPNHNKAAQQELARRSVQRLGLASVGFEVEAVDPRDVLSEELYRSLVIVRGLESLVGERGVDIHGPTFHATGVRTGETSAVWEWSELQKERAHLLRVSSEAAKAGVEARRVELIERFAADMVSLVQRILGDGRLGLSPAQREAAIDVAADHFRLLPPGKQ